MKTQPYFFLYSSININPWATGRKNSCVNYHVRTDDFYKDMKTDGSLYDMSNFDHPATKHFYDKSNKKVVGKFKDETDGMPIREYVGLRPKMYSLTYGAAECFACLCPWP